MLLYDGEYADNTSFLMSKVVGRSPLKVELCGALNRPILNLMRDQFVLNVRKPCLMHLVRFDKMTTPSSSISISVHVGTFVTYKISKNMFDGTYAINQNEPILPDNYKKLPIAVPYTSNLYIDGYKAKATYINMLFERGLSTTDMVVTYGYIESDSDVIVPDLRNKNILIDFLGPNSEHIGYIEIVVRANPKGIIEIMDIIDIGLDKIKGSGDQCVS